MNAIVAIVKAIARAIKKMVSPKRGGGQGEEQ
jgi:hypothetical protein